MKHLLTYNYILWLKKFREAHARNQQAVQKSCALIKELPAVGSIEQLNKLLTHYTDSKKHGSPSVFGPRAFHSRLALWLGDLKKLSINHLTATEHINELNATHANAPLIRFLRDLINNPKALLHVQIADVLEIIRHECLPELVEFLMSLPQIPNPASSHINEIALMGPLNPDHKVCLNLLNNLKAASKESGELLVLGNKLLLSSLLIYQDVHLEEINLEDEEEFVPPEANHGCIIV